jgi:hypothetical protein
LCAIAVLLFCGTYVYLVLHDIDALRSEQFTLEKMRLEKGVLGDSLSGFREVTDHSAATPASGALGQKTGGEAP